jgi:hypothetical protein
MGMATTRFLERVEGLPAQVRFEKSEAVDGAGILFLLPSLLLQGLLKTRDVYRLPESHYYGVVSVVLTIAFMALARIKNPEQLKQCKPGEIGRIIGLDRVPEVKCLRNKIKLLSQQQQASRLNNMLIDHWYETKEEDSGFLYVDGHVRIYYGYKANLPAKYVSRQKLCLSATTEYWVNDASGLPVMMVMGQLNEKLQHAIEYQIIPQLQNTVLMNKPQPNAGEPICTLIFDREAYHPEFFYRLWDKYKIAVITYRKNVKDLWPDECFESMDCQVSDRNVNMQICEMGVYLDKYWFREIRRKNQNGHQTSILTTNFSIKTPKVAGRMFSRWTQENFFKYFISDYDFDKMISFGIETIDPDQLVVNPQYRSLTHQLKKVREKKRRLEARFYPITQQIMDEPIDNLPILTSKQIEYIEGIEKYKQQETQLLQQRKQQPPKIKLSQMPDHKRYNRLKTESKLLMNVIKMIAYRAESAVASIITPYLSRSDDEKRMAIKQIIESNADIEPDYENQTLTITLHSLSAKRFNRAAQHLAELLNQTMTIFPNTNLRMIFKLSAFSNCER